MSGADLAWWVVPRLLRFLLPPQRHTPLEPRHYSPLVAARATSALDTPRSTHCTRPVWPIAMRIVLRLWVPVNAHHTRPLTFQYHLSRDRPFELGVICFLGQAQAPNPPPGQTCLRQPPANAP
eukprot:1533682-Rhodomonas_salina.1